MLLEKNVPSQEETRPENQLRGDDDPNLANTSIVQNVFKLCDIPSCWNRNYPILYVFDLPDDANPPPVLLHDLVLHDSLGGLLDVVDLAKEPLDQLDSQARSTS